jgi:NAD(P)-dependent dehydrogenase (short-subunit alcohol dehydrogenase family)
MLRLKDKVALVTGAGSGIGLAVAKRLTAEGADVLAADMKKPDRAQTGFEFLPLDVRSEDAWTSVTRKIADKFGRLDILVNNAGIIREAPLEQTTMQVWNEVLSVNLTGVFLGCKHLLPLLTEAETAAIVNVASVDALRGSHGHVAYAASKGGIVSLTRALALELADRNIRVNAVCPGTVDTPMVEAILSSADDVEAAEANRLAIHPLGRISSADEQAATIAFLCSADASFVTGAVLTVDGGRAIR